MEGLSESFLHRRDVTMVNRQDDFDVEVSALASSTAHPEPKQQDAEDAPSLNSSARAPTTAPTTAPRRNTIMARRSGRQRLIQAASALTLLTLLVSAILLLPVDNRTALLGAVIPPTPSPTATPAPGYDTFLWEHSVPWGELLIDTHPGPDVSGSATRRDADGLPQGIVFRLPPGRHTLTYRALPFPTLTCTLSVPVSRADTCPLNRSVDFGFLVPYAPSTRLLDLQATVDRLPTDQRQALLATTQAYFTAQTSSHPPGTLAVGDHYLDPTGQLARATSALQLQPQVRLDASVDQYFRETCATLCSATGLDQYSSPDGWAVLAPLNLTWQYATAGGTEVASSGPAQPQGVAPYTMIPLRVGWQDGRWQTPTELFPDAQADPVICPIGTHQLEVAVQASSGANAYGWPAAVTTAEHGCVFAGSARDVTTGNSVGPIALVLYRAGALVAVNDQAHQIFPTLPVASAHERALGLAVAPTSLQ
jgi:hypothetical protein